MCIRDRGWTALKWAAQMGDAAVVRVGVHSILQSCCSITRSLPRGCSPRAAMLGFLGTTIGDALTRGDGPIEQLTLESSYVARHVNPMELARDALELGGFYVESVVLVWLVLGSALLLGFSQGLRNPIRTVSGRHAGQRAQAAFSEIEKAYEANVRGQKPYELFNGRLAMLGTVFAFVGDVETGGLGPLEQVNQEFGIPVVDEEIFAILFLAGVSFNVVSTGVTAFRRAYAKGRE